MTNLVIVGSMGIDDVETPFGKHENLLGGAATYASYASSFFSKSGIISIVGEDFPEEHLKLLRKKKISTAGIEKKGLTFRWKGFYEGSMGEAKTLQTDLNCITEFNPVLPEEYKNAKFLFLGNLDPELQLKTLSQFSEKPFVVADTMNFWIQGKKEKLMELIKKVDVMLLNEGEAKMLFSTANPAKSAQEILSMGPKAVIIKKGENGAVLYTKNTKKENGSSFNANSINAFYTPAYPVELVKDPTGCGDSFGGAFIGYIAKTAKPGSITEITEKNMKKALLFATAVASFNAEDFSFNKLKEISKKEINERFNGLKQMIKL